ncbi:MAG: RsmE family RNA methyltransferase [bacterium]
MRLHRFFVHTPISSETFDIVDKDLVHQWKNVFRYNVGSQVILFDGSGTDYLCMISSIRNLGATVQVVSKKSQPSPEATAHRRNIWLCVALIKKDNFELVVQKATELGVTNIVPILCEHSEKRKLNMERMQKIAVEASEQSGRGDIPVIHEPQTISEIFESGALPQEKIIFHTDSSDTIPFKQYISSTNAVSFASFIGPEGGFSDKEIALFKSYNIPAVSLGTQILRAETAAIAVSTLFLL